MGVSIERAVQLLDALGESETPPTIRELADHLHLSKSAVQRTLRGLVDTDLAVQDPETRRYRLGPRTLALGMAYQRRIDIRAIARPHMSGLRDRTGETVGLTIRVGETAMHIDQVESPAELKYTFAIGTSHPLWSGAPCRLLLADLPDDDVTRIARDRTPGAVHPVAPPDPPTLITLVERARADGYAAAFEETLLGVHTLAVPVRDEAEHVTATISVTGPSVRLTRSRMDAILPDLRDVAMRVSRELGHRL